MFASIVLLTALSVSAVAAYYSIVGLAAIFAASVIPVIVMGTVLEVGKLVAVTFLHDYWSRINFLLKTYLSLAVVVLMFITSMGIFGFLSKAHIEQTATAGDNTLKIERIDGQIAREQRAIKDAETVLLQLDAAVQTLLDYDRVRGKDGAIATREKQKEERASLGAIIASKEDSVDKLTSKKFELETEQNALEAEVGPIKYIAELVYSETSRTILEDAVRWVIIVIVAVFDPLAVCLLLAWNSIHAETRRPKKKTRKNETATVPTASRKIDQKLDEERPINNREVSNKPPGEDFVWDERKKIWKKKKAGATS